MGALICLTICIFLVASVHGYGSKPPTVHVPEICHSHMEPHHHSNASTDPAHWKLHVGSPCYKAGMRIPVGILKIDSSSSHYFEGFLVLARDMTDMAGSGVGTFDTNGDEQMLTLSCFNVTDNAIGQKGAKHYHEKHFAWIAPSDFHQSIKFQSTIVHNTATYWLGVFSDEIVYNAECADITTPATTTESAVASLHASILSMVVVACFTLFAR